MNKSEDSYVFKVLHKNGSEWTLGQVADYLGDVTYAQTGFMLYDMDGFAVDESGNLMITDKCGGTYPLNGDDFIISWNV